MNELDKSQDLDLVFLIDRSGSMFGSEQDTIGGFNSFIETERKKEFNTNVTTILFDDKYEVLYERKPINDVERLTREQDFVRGTTALLDAIGKTITSLDRKVNNKVLFVIMTDGLENASVEFSRDQIKNMISNHDWEFVYIGADIDSYAESGRIGIAKSRTANYCKSLRGFDALYSSVSKAADCMRENKSLDDADWKKELDEYD